MPGRHSSAPTLNTGNTKKPIRPIVIAGIIGFVLQVVLAPNIAIAGISPNFMLIVLIPVACTSSQGASTVAGFIFGLLFDLVGSGPVGGMALVLALVGFITNMVTGQLKIEGFATWMIVLSVTALLANLAFSIVLSIMGYEQSFLASIAFKVLPWTIYDMAIGAIAWIFARRMVVPKTSVLDSHITL